MNFGLERLDLFSGRLEGKKIGYWCVFQHTFLLNLFLICSNSFLLNLFHLLNLFLSVSPLAEYDGYSLFPTPSEDFEWVFGPLEAFDTRVERESAFPWHHLP